jgi:DNA modification methylase
MIKETIGLATLYCADCKDVIGELEQFDAMITDPPYGIGEAAGKNKSRGKLAFSKDYDNDSWDDKPIDQGLINKLINKANLSIIFGGNYYALPPSSCWLIWDKLNGKTDFADCEMAWTNLNKSTRLFRFMWNGMLRENKEPRGEHPTQKPVPVMNWCISHIPEAKTIIDPFMGSGTTGVSAVKADIKFTGIEREIKYFDIACRRIEDAQRQIDLFKAG